LTEITEPEEVDRLLGLCGNRNRTVPRRCFGKSFSSLPGSQRRPVSLAPTATMTCGWQRRYLAQNAGKPGGRRCLRWTVVRSGRTGRRRGGRDVLGGGKSRGSCIGRDGRPVKSGLGSGTGKPAADCEGPGRVGAGPSMDEPTGPQFHDPNHVAVDGAEPGTGHPADDHLFRASCRRFGAAASGDWHSAVAAQPGNHLAGLVHDAFDHGSVWKQVYDESIVPYTQHKISLDEAWTKGVTPIRRFMVMQIDHAGNSDDVWLFVNHVPNRPTPTSYDDVPLMALLPAFMLSELKTAFLIDFRSIFRS